MIYVRSGLFYLMFFSTTMLLTVVVLVSRIFGKKFAWQASKLWGITSNFYLRFFCGIKVKVEGSEHIPNEPCVVVAKHQSTWETTTLPLIIPPFAWVLKKELMNIPLFGWVLYALGAIPIQRSNPREALKQVNDKGLVQLQAGRSVVIFPEGTRTAVGDVGNYQPSAMMLAKKAGVGILPISHNAGVCWPKGSLLKHPGTITVRILPMISAQDVHDTKRGELLAQCQASIEQTCRELHG